MTSRNPPTQNFEHCSWPEPKDVRHEIKFVVSPLELFMVEAWLAGNRAGWRRLHSDRFITNVYLDTFDLEAYAQNQAGDSERRKLRFRWYGATWASTGGVLELKCRRDSVGWKWSAAADWSFDLSQDTWGRWRDGLRPQLPGLHRMLLDARPAAVLVNRYHRSYYGSRDGKLRLTVDRDLAAWPQLGAARPRLGRPARTPEVVVLELKCAVVDRDHAAEVIADMPWRIGRSSKYTMGVGSIENL